MLHPTHNFFTSRYTSISLQRIDPSGFVLVATLLFSILVGAENPPSKKKDL